MDFKSYYINQAGNGLPYFQGSPYQKGYGLGGVFRNIFRWIMPIVREHALPVVKTIGKELLRTATNVANDSINGEEVVSSAKRRIKESLNSISNKLHEGEGLILKPGLSINLKKRKRLKSKKTKKRIIDIFDKK